jgi:transcriptional regulator with XRE-family HTH domain
MEVIGERVRQAMNAKSWTAQRLVDELARVNPDLKWTTSVVANLTSRRRRYVTVDELLALAVVLGVHPVDLLVPADVADDEPHSVTPTVTTTAGAARAWIAGEGFLTEPETWVELAEAIRLMPKERAEAMSRLWWTRERQDESARAANREQLGGQDETVRAVLRQALEKHGLYDKGEQEGGQE